MVENSYNIIHYAMLSLFTSITTLFCCDKEIVFIVLHCIVMCF